MPVLRSAWLALVAISLAGCASFATMSTARNLPAGAAQVYVAPHVLGTGVHAPAAPAGDHGADEHGAAPAGPSGAIDLDMEVGARYGVTDAFFGRSREAHIARPHDLR
jgi:hypothetical protein